MNFSLQQDNNSKWVLHDYLQVNGGAERLISTIVNGISGFSLGVSSINSNFLKNNSLNKINIEILGGLPKFIPRIPRALITFSNKLSCMENADTVIYSGIYAPLAVQRQIIGRRIYYCHTPPRFAIDRKEQYLERFSNIIQPLIGTLVDNYFATYKSCIRQMDLVLTNSEHMYDFIEKHFGISARVIYPPVNINKYKWMSQGDYYLSVGRLEPNKRIDRIVKAFITMPDKKLIVTSGGSQFKFLQTLAKDSPNIFFTDWLTDDELIELIGNAISSIYIPFDEDFGMSAIESMSAGKPVIGVDEGGLKESIIDRVTGILLPQNPQVDDICSAVCLMNAKLAISMRDQCEKHASNFSESRFLKQIKSCI